MDLSIKKACLFLGFFFFNLILLKGQDWRTADSLIFVYTNQELDDSTNLTLLEGISFYHPNPEIKLSYAEKLIGLALKNSNDLFLFRGYFQSGNAYRLKGDLGDAVSSYLTSIKIAKKIKYETGIGAGYLALGTVYSINEDYKNSILNFRKAIHILEEQRDTINLAAALMNTGDNFYNSQQIDSALFYFQKSGSLYEAVNYEIGIAYNLGNLGLVYAKQENYAQAEENLKKASAVLVKLGDFYPVAVYYISIAEIFNQKKNIPKALYYAHLSLQISQQHGLKEQIRDASLKLSEIFSQTKDYEKAYHHHTQYVAYRDSINNEEVIRKMADLRTEHEVSQKQAEIDLLTKQHQFNRLIGIGLVFITILLAALAFILFRNNRIKKAVNKVLSSQKHELEIQHHKLDALNHTKDRFFSIISHDLRGPVNAFNGLSGLIKHYIAHNEMGQLREVSEYIDKSARQLSALLDNLLDWAVKQQGAFPFHPEKINLNTVLKEIEEMFGITAHAKNIMLTVTTEEEIILWADRNSLTTILRNLVNNALKFTEQDGLVTISAYSQKNFAFINIMDTGVGIPEDQLEKLFKIKDKVSSRGTSGEKGLGIGLSLAYEFTKMNKGTIMVNSEEKAGTIFTVKIPLYGHKNFKEEKTTESMQEIIAER